MHRSVRKYREWLLADKAAKFYEAPETWKTKVQTPNGERWIRYEGSRIVKEIEGRPIAEGAERDE